ncbi:hypothetical protein DFR86_11420 [Acidianus sulfidivorans JP7]|uniref:CRISPR type III-associated protein domain-containing protein n=1 Tax=Acidianus sulfidivorans JP7 TaxID=619593 RepID=A0A2U9IQ33_9CREN|nr:RAMP superfamily CRISPR-associated protein [Acidianus sulfidivorans]AWR98084.1 hypothetical protein DFR86_11420 [Acidianus sulfidivorans JP7]
MTDYNLFLVRNESPLVINYASGNYFKSLDYIPASSIIGAIKARKIKDWGGKREDVKINLTVSDAYPSSEDQTTLNPPGLVTLYKEKESDEFYVDGLKKIMDTVNGKLKWGEETLRLKKGPQNWIYKNNKAYPISVKMFRTTLLKLDEYTKIPLIEKKGNENIGYMAHVEAMLPGHIFSFIASGEVDEIEKALKEGIYVGSFKTKGFGLIKLITKKKITLNDCNGGTCVLDFYGNVSYETYEKIKRSGCDIIYENVTFDKRKTFYYDEWKIDIVVRSGSIMVVKNCKLKLDEENGGKVIVNHPIHQ